MKKLFNDNAKTIALLALAGCVVLGIVLYKQSHKKPCNPAIEDNTKIKVEPAAETQADEKTAE